MKRGPDILRFLISAALVVVAAGCTKSEQPTGPLPEGRYPVQIGALCLSEGSAEPWGGPSTRLSETTDGTTSLWEGTERIGVQIAGSEENGSYAVQADGSASAESPLYWRDREPHEVYAWYPVEGSTLDLSDQQTHGLAYLLRGTGRGDYATPVTLTFTHSLAKVRITPTAEALGEVHSLQLYTYTGCTHTQGSRVSGTAEGWVEMRRCDYNGTACWEANVVPGYAISRLRANGTEERTLSAPLTPQAGNLYSVTLGRGPGYTYDAATHTYLVTARWGLMAWHDAALVDPTLSCRLLNDITLSPDVVWEPVGSNDAAYTGIFDGGGYTLTGLTVTGSTTPTGMFGVVGSGGTVQELRLTNASISGVNEVGGVAGLNHGGTLSGCRLWESTVRGDSQVGGIVGNNTSRITDCGVVGSSIKATGGSVGGVIGLVPGPLSGTDPLASVNGCYNEGTSVSAAGDDVGGVVGHAEAPLTGCYNLHGPVTTNGIMAGGVVGYCWGGSSVYVAACYSTGDVTGARYVGGIAGRSDVPLTACYFSMGTLVASEPPHIGIGAIAGYGGWPINPGCFYDTYIGEGLGGGEGSVTSQIVQVDGLSTTWSSAADRMNSSIQSWNNSYPTQPCPWQYVTAAPNALPALFPLH